MLDGVMYLSVLGTVMIFLPENAKAYDRVHNSLLAGLMLPGSGRRCLNSVSVNDGQVSKSAELNLIIVSFRGSTVSGTSTTRPLKNLVSRLISNRLM